VIEMGVEANMGAPNLLLRPSIPRVIALLTCAVLLASTSAAAPGGRRPQRSAAAPERVEQTPGCRVPVVGPLSVTRGKGGPRFERFTFETPDPSAPHFLHLDNGGASGESRPVTSAHVFLNGALLLGPERFDARLRSIEEPISPAATNDLAFRLAGKPGSGLAFEVFALDSQPPSFSGVLPPDGSVVSEPQVTLVVTVDDALAGVAQVTCAGIEATPIEEDFACTVPLAPGPNAIDIVATDACANESRTQVVIEFDPPPVVAITSPDDGDLIIRGPVVVTGTVDDPAASVTVNGVPATGAPTFTATVPVRRGENTLLAVARDAVGGEGSDSVQVTVLVGSTGPTVSISSPAPGFLFGGPRTNPPTLFPVPVRGRARAEGGSGAAGRPMVLVNGAPATVTLGALPGLQCSLFGVCWWDFSAPLLLGKAGNPHVIEAIGTDRFGQSDADSVTGNIDECVIGGSDGNAILDAATGQSNRCHFIDGCSAPFRGVLIDRQDPTDGKLGRRSTAFGKDTSTTDFDPHGVAPRDDLPCNQHDVCYQTCGADKVACDDAMFDEMQAVCRAAYPESTCPYLPNLVQCNVWKAERDRCHAWARRYRAALSLDEWVDDRFGARQSEFCR
jgi:hypothetical protein